MEENLLQKLFVDTSQSVDWFLFVLVVVVLDEVVLFCSRCWLFSWLCSSLLLMMCLLVFVVVACFCLLG